MTKKNLLFWGLSICSFLNLPTKLSAQDCVHPISNSTVETDVLRVQVSTMGINPDQNSPDGGASLSFRMNDSTNLHTLYSTGIWIGAYDGTGALRVGANRSGHSSDFAAGPLNSSAQVDSNTCQLFDNIWHVSQEDVYDIIGDFYADNNLDMPIPVSLQKWPAKGNPYFQSAMGTTYDLSNQDLAPFYDRTNDGVYDPADGDYPVFDHGNQNAIAKELFWSVYNDVGATHSFSQGNSMGIEIQHTNYILACDDYAILDSTVFTKYKITNKAASTYNDLKVGFLTDFDIGCYDDDLLGTDSTLNTMYAYNGDLQDDNPCGFGGTYGFEDKAGTQTVTLLNQDIDKSIMTLNSTSGVAGDPSDALEIYRFISGLWNDASSLTVGGDGHNPNNANAIPANFIFPDYPLNTSLGAWSGLNSFFAQDIRGIMSIHRDSFTSNEVLTYDLAYTFIRDTTLDNWDVTELIPSTVNRVQQIYDNGFSDIVCTQQISSSEIHEQQISNIRVYPNPATHQVNVELENMSNIWNFQIIDLMGRNLKSKTNLMDNKLQINVEDIPTGIYFYQISSQQGSILHSGKIIINK